MAFDAFLQQDGQTRGARSVTIGVSLALHVMALGYLAVRSFWTVDELAPPSTQIKLMWTAARPAAPPPPAVTAAGNGGGGGEKSKPAAQRQGRVLPRVPRPVVAEAPKPEPTPRPDPKADEVKPPPTPAAPAEPAQAPAAPASAPVAAATGSGGPGSGPGIGGGTGGGGTGTGGPGGVPGGTGTAPRAMFLPEALGKLQRISGGEPDFPRHLAKAGVTYVVQAKVCVGPQGNVEKTTVVKGADPTLDGNVITATAGWRYRPMMSNGNAVPFCTFVRFEFRGE